MNSEANIPEEPTGYSSKMLRAMVGIGIACALLIVFTYEASKPRIKKLKQEALEKAITKVIPGITKSQAYILSDNEMFAPFTGEANGVQLIYAGYDAQGILKGIAVEASGQGYADIIRILYGYDVESEKITGFYVLESKETPGLGDKIEKDETFMSNFKALDVTLNEEGSSLANEVITVKSGEKKNEWEIDGITGATISSRAIGDIINSSASEITPLIVKQKETFIKVN